MREMRVAAELKGELEASQAQCTKASALLARSEHERLEGRSSLQQAQSELSATVSELGRANGQARLGEQTVRGLIPVQQRAAVLEAEKQALCRELDLARRHGEDLLKAAKDECEKVTLRLDATLAHGRKQALELEASAARAVSSKAEHADGVRLIEAECEQKCAAMTAELRERQVELSDLSGKIGVVKEKGEAALSREAEKATGRPNPTAPARSACHTVDGQEMSLLTDLFVGCSGDVGPAE